ncbi:MAG: DUF3006 domain-containing protein [Oscillospiraceae bacterium]
MKNINKDYYSIDRFEGKKAILINDKSGNTITIEKSQIAGSPEEGDIIYLHDTYYVIDAEMTKIKRNEINLILNEILK